MKALYRFHWDYGRMGDVTGLFIASQDKVSAQIGKAVHFGEILGKHSDVHGHLGYEDLEIVTEDQGLIDTVESLLGANISGYNPLIYVAEEEET